MDTKYMGAASNGKYKRLRTVSKKSVKWKHTKLKKGKQYKYYVKAYKKINGKPVTIAKSLSIYSTTKGGKSGNPSKVEVKKTRIGVKTGKKVRLYVKVTGKKISKTGKNSVMFHRIHLLRRYQRQESSLGKNAAAVRYTALLRTAFIKK